MEVNSNNNQKLYDLEFGYNYENYIHVMVCYCHQIYRYVFSPDIVSNSLQTLWISLTTVPPRMSKTPLWIWEVHIVGLIYKQTWYEVISFKFLPVDLSASKDFLTFSVKN